MNILVIGDVHARFHKIEEIINDKHPDAIIQLGDFGFWPLQTRMIDEYSNIINSGIPIYWCDGNHEDHDRLNDLVSFYGRVPIEIVDNCFYMPRGSTLILPNKMTALFMGGASSIDKLYRTPGYDWFTSETISNYDLDSLPNKNIDIIFSHDAPSFFNLSGLYIDNSCMYNRNMLNIVFNKYNIKQWFFAHYHTRQSGVYGDCQWTCLDRIDPVDNYTEPGVIWL